MGFLGGSVVKNLPANARDTEDAGLASGWEDPPEEDMATHSRTFAGIIPRTEETGGLQATRLQRVGHIWITEHAHTHTVTLIFLYIKKILYVQW